MRVKHIVLSSIVGLAIAVGFIQQVDAAPIHDAARRGDLAVVQQELDNGVGVNLADDRTGNTALMIAANNGHTDCVQALIDAGAKVNHTNSMGFTTLMGAALTGHTQCVQALIDAVANLDYAGVFGNTALMRAAVCGRTVCVQALIDAGANVNHTNKDGYTALDIATKNGDAETVEAIQNHIDEKTNYTMKSARKK